MHHYIATAVLAAGLIASPATAQTTIWSTFGPDNAYNESVGGAIGSASDYRYAAGFTYAGPAGMSLFDISFGAFHVSGGSLLAEFLSDDGNGPVLESWTVAPASPDVPAIYTITSVLQPTLATGESYLLRLSGIDGSSWAWSFNNQGIYGNWVSADGEPLFATNNTTPAFAVRAAPATSTSTVPEPATLTLLATGMLALAGRRRRR